MKVLFFSSYLNNGFLIPFNKKTMDRNIKNCEWEFLCLNNAPELGKEDNFVFSLGHKEIFVSTLDGKEDCYNEIKNNAKEANFHHIKLPQNIHTQNRPNHNSQRHSEILNYFFKNIESLFPRYKDFDYLCSIDSDAFFTTEIDLKKEIEDFDLISPLIYKDKNNFFPHVGMFFINLKTVTNFNQMDFSLRWKDTGSGLLTFMRRNRKYRIKEIGKYEGYWNLYYETPNDIGIIKLGEHIIDRWFNGKVHHLRFSTDPSVGTLRYRCEKNVESYKDKIKTLFDNFHIPYDKSKF